MPVELARLPGNCTLDDICECSDRDGGVIIEDWMLPEVVEAFNAEIEPWLAAHAGTDSGTEASDEFLGLRTRRLQGLVTKAPTFVRIMTDERLVGYATEVIGPISPVVILNNGEVIDIGPGETAQPFHRDDDAWNFARPGVPMIVNSILALADITPEIGGTLVVPGSHRWDRDRVPASAEIVAATMRAGSALFFRGDLLHGGGANITTDRRRRALSTGICAGWLRPVENSYINVPPDVARDLPRSAQELLGYALYDASSAGGGYLGYHDMGDPMCLFD